MDSFPDRRTLRCKNSLVSEVLDFSIGFLLNYRIAVVMRASLIVLLVAATFATLTSCKTPPKRLSEATIVRGLSDDELAYLALRLNARVEALGMSDYRVTSSRWSFNVLAHNDLTRRRKPVAAEPVLLRTSLPGTTRVIEARIEIAQGLSLATVEMRFRKFIDEIKAASART